MASTTKRLAARRVVSPVARRIASLEQIDLAMVGGTGPSGRITKADVLSTLHNRDVESRSAEPSKTTNLTRIASFSPPSTGFFLPLSTIGEPYALTAFEVDFSNLIDSTVEKGLSEDGFVAVVFAVAATLARYPLLNARWTDNGILVWRRLHVQILRDAQRMLVHDAQDLNARGLARALRRAPANDSDSGTFTITVYNGEPWLGMPPLVGGQSAALGLGTIRMRPFVVTDNNIDRVAVRPIGLISLAYDARVLNQSHADAFLGDIKRALGRVVYPARAVF